LTPTPAVRQVFLATALSLLLVMAWFGLSGGLSQLPQSHSPGQKAQSVTQLGYGLFALLSVVTTFWGRRWGPASQVCWVLSVAVAGGLASVVWGATSVVIGLLSGAATLLVAWAIIWLLRTGARGM
jgi:hypothetical protein